LNTQFGGIQSDVNNYSSKLNNADFSGLNSGLTSFQNWLGEQQNAYNTEKSRINDFSTGLRNSILDYGNTLDGLTIADLDQINALDNSVANTAREAMNFNPLINTDFSSYINSLQGLDTKVDSLRDANTAEQQRIGAFGKQTNADIQNLINTIGGMGLTSGSQFDSARNAIANLQGGINNFDSLLSTDFSGQLNSLNDAQAQLDALYGQRRANIDEILGRADAQRQGATDAGLWEEQKMRDALRAMNDEMYNLSKYSGGRTGDDRNQLQAGIDAINNRLNELTDYRGGIENRAQGLLDQIQNTQFYGQADVDRMRGLFDALQSEGNQYNATQAQDELATALQILTGNQNRLTSEAESLAARKAREAQAASGELFGIDRNYILSQLEGTDMTPEEYQALVSRVKQQDPEFANQIISQYGALFGA
jgi:hypothetical protein